MRKELSKEEGKRKKFTAVFVRLGKKAGYRGPSVETILLQHITDAETGQVVADHLWFTLSKGFKDVINTQGVTIEFEARVKIYTKGYVNRQLKINHRKEDYKLSHPTRIKIINKDTTPLLP